MKSFFKIHKAKVELLSFNSEILLHLSYSKNRISGSFTFHKSKLHIIYLNLLPNSHTGKTAKIIMGLNPYDIFTDALTQRAFMTTRNIQCFTFSANLSPYSQLGFFNIINY